SNRLGRMRDAIRNEVVSREVQHCDRLARDHLLDQVRIDEIAFEESDTRRVRQVLPSAFEERVDDVYFVAAVEQCSDDGRADEARASRHQYPFRHSRSPRYFDT